MSFLEKKRKFADIAGLQKKDEGILTKKIKVLGAGPTEIWNDYSLASAVIVVAGQHGNSQIFHVDRETMVKHSPVFKMFCDTSKPCTECRTGVVYLPEMEPKIFQAIHEWLVSRRQPPSSKKTSITLLSQILYAASFLQIDKLRESMMVRLIGKDQPFQGGYKHLGLKAVIIAWEAALPESVDRGLVTCLMEKLVRVLSRQDFDRMIARNDSVHLDFKTALAATYNDVNGVVVRATVVKNACRRRKPGKAGKSN